MLDVVHIDRLARSLQLVKHLQQLQALPILPEHVQQGEDSATTKHALHIPQRERVDRQTIGSCHPGRCQEVFWRDVLDLQGLAASHEPVHEQVLHQQAGTVSRRHGLQGAHGGVAQHGDVSLARGLLSKLAFLRRRHWVLQVVDFVILQGEGAPQPMQEPCFLSRLSQLGLQILGWATKRLQHLSLKDLGHMLQGVFEVGL